MYRWMGLALLFLVWSCGKSLVLVKPGATQQDIALDDYQCRRETGYVERGALERVGLVLQATSAGYEGRTDVQARMSAIRQAEDLYYRCMAARGYELRKK